MGDEICSKSKGGGKGVRNNLTYYLNKTPDNGNTYRKYDKQRRGSYCKSKIALDQENNF